MLFFRPFYAVPVESVADAGVQNLADVPQVRDLLLGDRIKQALHAAPLWRYFAENRLL